MKSLHPKSVSLFDKLGRDGVRYLGLLALGDCRRPAPATPTPTVSPPPHSVAEFLLEALSSGAPRLSGRG